MNVNQIENHFKKLQQIELIELYKSSSKLIKANKEHDIDSHDFMNEFKTEMQIMGLTPSMQSKSKSSI